jgi:hypothetical protein
MPAVRNERWRRRRNCWLLHALRPSHLVGRRQSSDLDGWLYDSVSEDGWTAGSVERLRSQADWLWLAALGGTRDVTVQSLVADQTSPESAFTLVTHHYGTRAGAARHVGLGMTTALPRTIAPAVLAAPVSSDGLGPSFEWFVGLDLPKAEVGELELRRRWSLWSQEPGLVRNLLAGDPALRAAFNALFEEVWAATRFQYLVLELNGAVATLIGDPKVVGRQPFVELRLLADALVSRLHGRTPAG